MKKLFLVTLSAFLVLSTFFAGSASPAIAKEPKILEFDTMVGIPQAFTGTQNPIRGINGGGLPWTIGSAKGELTVGGHLEIKVQGLVSFPATTGPASSGGGNSEIETNVSLPHPCIAPIVFVTSPGGAWFAATGS